MSVVALPTPLVISFAAGDVLSGVSNLSSGGSSSVTHGVPSLVLHRCVSNQNWKTDDLTLNLVAALTLLCHEYCVTFPDEVTHMWPSKWTVGKGLFVVTRYLPFIDVSVMMWSKAENVRSPVLLLTLVLDRLSPTITPSLCRWSYFWGGCKIAHFFRLRATLTFIQSLIHGRHRRCGRYSGPTNMGNMGQDESQRWSPSGPLHMLLGPVYGGSRVLLQLA